MSKPAHTARELMLAHQYIYYVLSDNVWSDYEYDQFCERNGLDGTGGSDCAMHYTIETVVLATNIRSNPQNYPPTMEVKAA